jgi:hypothetical protein
MYAFAKISDKINENCVVHIRKLMGEICNALVTGTTTIWEDNQSAISYSLMNALVSEKTKHNGLKWHFLKDHVE